MENVVHLLYGGMSFLGMDDRSWSGVILSISSVQSLSRVQLFATPWTAAFQASLPITNSQSLLKLMYVKSVMSSYHLTLCRPLFSCKLINTSENVCSVLIPEPEGPILLAKNRDSETLVLPLL